jgi:hypothetical protein
MINKCLDQFWVQLSEKVHQSSLWLDLYTDFSREFRELIFLINEHKEYSSRKQIQFNIRKYPMDIVTGRFNLP